MKSDTGVSVTSTRGKLEVLQRHSGKSGVGSDFDSNWKEEVESKVSSYGSMSESCEDDRLDIAIEKGEIVKCNMNNKTGGSDGFVGELLKYGGLGMVCLLEQLFSVVWHEETVPRQWREGFIVNLFKRGDREDPGNYRGITVRCFVKYLTMDWYVV